jgi:hypothetical protein
MPWPRIRNRVPLSEGPAHTIILEGGLHPQTGGASEEERVQLRGQALTHAQKAHLNRFTGLDPDAMYEHLVGYHAISPSPPTLRRISGFDQGIPTYKLIPNLTSRTGYVTEHLTLHQADLAERKTSRVKSAGVLE